MVILKTQAYTLQKAGTQPDQYEDAFAFDMRSGRAAVADGASDSFEARGWATTLTQSFVKKPPVPEQDAFMEWLEIPSRAWHVVLPWDELPWYAEQKARDVGGLATLLGFYLVRGAETNGAVEDVIRWRALAVGDACLLHLRDNELIHRFPIDKTEGFNSTPALLSTRLEHDAEVIESGELRTMEGTCQVGDTFLLATDAIAERLYDLADLEDLNIGLPDWESILSLMDDDFEGLIDQFREDALIRNDDVTLLVSRVEQQEDAS
jgi:hypothetical protein